MDIRKLEAKIMAATECDYSTASSALAYRGGDVAGAIADIRRKQVRGWLGLD